MIIYLVRHGESLARDGLGHAAAANIGLSTLGKKQALATGRALRRAGIEAIVTSTMKRAEETAAIIQSYCQAALYYNDKRLNEHMVAQNETDKAKVRYLRQKVREERDFTPPDGESFIESVARFRQALVDLASGGHDKVCVVSHREILQNFLLQEFHLKTPPAIHEASYAVLEYHGGSFDMLAANISPFSLTLWLGKVGRRVFKTLSYVS